MNKPTSHNERSHNTSGDSWGACPPGELQSMVGRLNAQQRTEHLTSFAKVAGGVAVAVLMLALGVGLLTAPDSISCQECLAKFEAYNSHLTDAELMDASSAAEMHKHLVECERCRGKFQKNYPGLLEKSLAAAGPAVAPTIRLSYLAMAATR